MGSAAIAGLIAGHATTNASPAFGAGGELLVAQPERDDNVYASYTRSGVAATGWACLVDLSDTSNWKHAAAGRLDVSFLSLAVDKPANSVGSVSVGVVTRVDGTSGDVYFFGGVTFNNATDTYIRYSENYSPSRIRLGVAGGLPSRLATGGMALNDASLRTGLPLDSIRGAGTIVPAVGDVVARFAYTSGGAYNAVARLLYRGAADA